MGHYLRVVTLASASGKYGGPFDTAGRQAANWVSSTAHRSVLLAGYLEGDRPHTHDSLVEIDFSRVRRMFPSPGFTGLASWAVTKAIISNSRLSELIHISMSREIIPLTALLVARLLRKPLVLQPHGMLTTRSTVLFRFTNRLLGLLMGKRALFLALTESEARELRAAFGLHIHVQVLGNPLPPEVRRVDLSITADAISDAVFIARLHPRKRVGVFVEAARESARRGWASKYSVVGPDGGDIALVTGITAENFAYEGAMRADQIVDRLLRTRVFVHTADNEPWGNVLVTAIALGIPVVVPESTALASTIRETGAGIVVPDSDAAAVAEAVNHLISDPEAYAQVTLGAARFTELYLSERQQIEGLRTAYSSAIELAK